MVFVGDPGLNRNDRTDVLGADTQMVGLTPGTVTPVVVPIEPVPVLVLNALSEV